MLSLTTEIRATFNIWWRNTTPKIEHIKRSERRQHLGDLRQHHRTLATPPITLTRRESSFIRQAQTSLSHASQLTTTSRIYPGKPDVRYSEDTQTTFTHTGYAKIYIIFSPPTHWARFRLQSIPWPLWINRVKTIATKPKEGNHETSSDIPHSSL